MAANHAAGGKHAQGKHAQIQLGTHPSPLARPAGHRRLVRRQAWCRDPQISPARRLNPHRSQPRRQKIFIARAAPGKAAAAPASPYLGLDHFGLTVPDIRQAVAALKAKGVTFTMDVTTARPGVQIAFLTAPENVSIELIQRG
jgi:catechol 2,3-dioxygenase-like lactoylglutathione lyase family enzyme